MKKDQIKNDAFEVESVKTNKDKKKSQDKQTLLPDFTLFDVPKAKKEIKKSLEKNSKSSDISDLGVNYLNNKEDMFTEAEINKANFEAEIKARIEAKLKNPHTKLKRKPPLRNIFKKNVNLENENSEKPETVGITKKPNKVVLKIILKTIFFIFIVTWIFFLGVLVGRQSVFEAVEVHELAEKIETTGIKIVGLLSETVNKTNEQNTENLSELSIETQAQNNDLPEKEHWQLFKKIVAENIEKLKLEASGRINTISPVEVKGYDWENFVFAPNLNQLTFVEKPIDLEEEVSQASSTAYEGHYFVQALVTTSEVEAKKEAEKLIERGYLAFYIYIKPWYNVRTGYYQDYTEAKKIRKELANLGYNRPYVQQVKSKD